MAERDTITIAQPLPVPFEVGDEDREEIIDRIKEARARQDEVEAEMAPLKELLKSAKDDMEKSVGELIAGRVQDVECRREIDWSANEVTITRLDTHEVVQVREVTEEDRQLHNGI